MSAGVRSGDGHVVITAVQKAYMYLYDMNSPRTPLALQIVRAQDSPGARFALAADVAFGSGSFGNEPLKGRAQ